MHQELVRLNRNRAVYHCRNCGKASEVPLSSLTVGTGGDPNIFSIACPGCPYGTVTFFNRTWDNPGTHARLVNSLHAELVAKGQTDARVKAILTEEKPEDKPFNAAALGDEDVSTDDRTSPFIPEVAEAIEATVKRGIQKHGSKGAVAQLS